ncbi:hypothetical protein [Peribacillus muralis]
MQQDHVLKARQLEEDAVCTLQAASFLGYTSSIMVVIANLRATKV